MQGMQCQCTQHGKSHYAKWKKSNTKIACTMVSFKWNYRIHLVTLFNRLLYKELKSLVTVTHHRPSNKEWLAKRIMDPLV